MQNKKLRSRTYSCRSVDRVRQRLWFPRIRQPATSRLQRSFTGPSLWHFFHSASRNRTFLATPILLAFCAENLRFRVDATLIVVAMREQKRDPQTLTLRLALLH